MIISPNSTSLQQTVAIKAEPRQLEEAVKPPAAAQGSENTRAKVNPGAAAQISRPSAGRLAGRSGPRHRTPAPAPARPPSLRGGGGDRCTHCNAKPLPSVGQPHNQVTEARRHRPLRRGRGDRGRNYQVPAQAPNSVLRGTGATRPGSAFRGVPTRADTDRWIPPPRASYKGPKAACTEVLSSI